MEEDKDFGELLEQYMDKNNMHHFESESGVRNLTKIAEAIGYGDRYQDSLTAMLSDNPGMQQAMVDWLMQQDIQEWRDSLSAELPEKDEE